MYEEPHDYQISHLFPQLLRKMSTSNVYNAAYVTCNGWILSSGAWYMVDYFSPGTVDNMALHTECSDTIIGSNDEGEYNIIHQQTFKSKQEALQESKPLPMPSLRSVTLPHQVWNSQAKATEKLKNSPGRSRWWYETPPLSNQLFFIQFLKPIQETASKLINIFFLNVAIRYSSPIKTWKEFRPNNTGHYITFAIVIDNHQYIIQVVKYCGN